MADARAYYFGCGNESGHFWWQPSERPSRSERVATSGQPAGCPWGYEVDGRMQPGASVDGRGQRWPRDETQGPCALHRKDGWTLIAWWDRTVDKRSACCSAFAAEGDHDFATMVALLAERFPWVASRMAFELTEVSRG